MPYSPKIFLDARLYNHSGIGRYINDLYRSILAVEPSIKVTAAGDVSLLGEGGIFKNHQVVSYVSPIYSINEQIMGNIFVKRFLGKSDVFHFPHYNAPWFLPKRSVVTVHDITQFLFPEFFGRIKPAVARLVLSNSLKGAGRIIAVSESTKNNLVKYYPRFEDKMVVVYNGISKHFSPMAEDEIWAFKKDKGLENYILYVGNRKPHKNIKRFLEAFSMLKVNYKILKLLIVGNKFSEVDEIDIWRKKNPVLSDDVIEVESISDSELHFFYCGAKALIHPSLHEGFGFPPLEAMSCGIPVVVSNVSSLPEICADAALYFNPRDVTDMAQKIDIILKDGTLRSKLIEKGLNRSHFFSWAKCAEKTLKVFEDVTNLSKAS